MMSKALRLHRAVLVAGLFLLAIGPAWATCEYGIFITQGVGGGSLDAATCGTAPSSVYWLIGHGDPEVEAGIDNGTRIGQVDPVPVGAGGSHRRNG